MDNYAYQQPVVHTKKRTFFSTLALGLSAVIVTTIASGTGIILYGMNIADRKSDNLTGLIEEAVQNLPEFIDSLPPALADVFHDQRSPEYARQLDVSVRLADTRTRNGRVRPIVEVRNSGDEMVSLLSMRIVILDAQGDPVAEMNEWIATPIAADHDWRGPLLPDATRTIPIRSHRCYDITDPIESLQVTYEITDVRTWDRQDTKEDI